MSTRGAEAASFSNQAVSHNRAPVFTAANVPPLNALNAADATNHVATPGSSVSLTTAWSGFSDPDGDALTFSTSTTRSDVFAEGTPSHITSANLLLVTHKGTCALKALVPAVPASHTSVVTLTATDPFGASASITRKFVMNWDSGLCPEITAAQVDGRTLTLTFERTGSLARTWSLSASEFTVKAGAAGGTKTAVTVNSVSVGAETTAGGKTTTPVTLTLAERVPQGHEATASYDPSNDDYPNVLVFTDQAVTVTDTTGPIFASAAVAADGTTLTVTFDEDLDPNSRPAANFFSLTYTRPGGTSRTQTGTGSVAISGKTATLTLQGEMSREHTLTLRYRKPGASPLQGTDGDDTADFSGEAVTNNSAIDNSEPVLNSVAVNGRTLTLSYDEDLNAGKAPAGSEFVIWAWPDAGKTGARRVLRGTGTAAISGATVTVTLESGVRHGETVESSYTPPPTNPLQDAAGNLVNFFRFRPTANNTPVDNTPPTVSGAAVDESTLTVTFNEDLNPNSRPAGSAFSVSATPSGGSTARILAGTGTAALASKTVTVTLASAVRVGEAVTVSYDKPPTNPLQDDAQNEVASFNGETADNMVRIVGNVVVCSPYDTYQTIAGYWTISNVYPTFAFGDRWIACDMAKPAWSYDTRPGVQLGKTRWLYDGTPGFISTTNLPPPVDQPHEAVTHLVPDHPDHRAVRGDDGQCYREEHSGGKWHRSVSYGSGTAACRNAAWNAHYRSQFPRLGMVDPDDGTFPSGAPPGDASGEAGGASGDSGGAEPASVTGVEVVSDAGADDTYGLGDTIHVRVSFDDTVDVTGTPRLKIDMDPAAWGEKWASFDSGSGTSSLTFAHTVVEPNLSTHRASRCSPTRWRRAAGRSARTARTPTSPTPAGPTTRTTR